MNKVEYDKKYYREHKTERTKRNREYNLSHKIEVAEFNKKYKQTINGWLRRCFSNIKRRCENSNCLAYKNYGERGIKCLFRNVGEFVNYVINELKVDPRNLQIDRVNNDGNYEPGNIRFVTRSENQRNKRNTKK